VGNDGAGGTKKIDRGSWKKRDLPAVPAGSKPRVVNRKRKGEEALRQTTHGKKKRNKRNEEL